MSVRNATFKVKTHLRVAFLPPKVAPRVYKTAKAKSCFVSLLVSLNSGEVLRARLLEALWILPCILHPSIPSPISNCRCL